MHTTKLCHGLAAAFLPLSASAQVTDDLWDLNRWPCLEIKDHSTIHGQSDIHNMFGLTGGVEPADMLFADDKGKGDIHFVEWRTTRPVELTGFRLYAFHDDDTQDFDRSFDHFTLRAKSLGSNTFDLVLFDEDVTVPYQFAGDFPLLIDASLDEPVDARSFRAEFTQHACCSFPGPRIVELDGLGSYWSCEVDLTDDGCLDLFDFLAFTNLFNAGDKQANCDGDGSLDIFDFLCFVNSFNTGCP